MNLTNLQAFEVTLQRSSQSRFLSGFDGFTSQRKSNGNILFRAVAGKLAWVVNIYQFYVANAADFRGF